MSKIIVDNITSLQDSPVVFDSSIIVPSGAQSTITGNINTTGIVTATSFSGDGSQLTGLGSGSVTASQIFAFALLTQDPPFVA